MNFEKELEQVNKELESLDAKKDWKEVGELKFRKAWLEENIERLKTRAVRLRSDSGLGERFLDYTFENFNEGYQERAFLTCKNYAELFKEYSDKSKNSLVIFGSYGTGKTHLSAAICNYIIDNYGIPVMYGTWAGHLNTIKANFNNEFAQEYLVRMKRIPLLIIDDYGQEKDTEWGREIFFETINHRYMDNLPVIITTNLNGSEMSNRVGGAIASRLTEMSRFLDMNGKDYRQQNEHINSTR